jgi:tRNA dimethylallyltransferase
VKQLIDIGINKETLIYYGLEYKFITLYLTGKISYQELVSDLEIAIHQFAKRQMTWFRGMERKGIKIHWIDGELPIEEKVKIVLDKL